MRLKVDFPKDEFCNAFSMVVDEKGVELFDHSIALFLTTAQAMALHLALGQKLTAVHRASNVAPIKPDLKVVASND